jgi:hypothetical protein
MLFHFRYEVKKDYIPPVILLSSLQPDNENSLNHTSSTSKPSNTNKTNSPIPSNNIEKNSSSLINFNLALSLICILLSFTYSIHSKY